MTYPRSHLIDPSEGVYHICSRCVRRAWLCGTDQQNGLNFDHRRQWLEDRILKLTSIFAVDLYGYAVMSNHYHLVINLNVALIESWSDTVVVDKWLSLCPKQHQGNGEAAGHKSDVERAMILQNPARLQVLRQRLGSISWLMRFINEPLARRANAEDGCKGRFWEGRFKSQRLLDENAVLACMVYIDLNPVRAGIVDDLVEAEHTSLTHRLASSEGKTADAMVAINTPNPLPFDRSLADYIALARWTTDAQRSYRRGGNPMKDGLDDPAPSWLEILMPRPGCWQRASGSTQSLKDYAKSIGQRWIKQSSMQLLI
jgi:hypothetical protein